MAKNKVKPIPKGYRSVTPAINVGDAKGLIEFCKKAFGGKLRTSMPGPDGKLLHAEVEIGDSLVMLSDAVMEPARPANVFLYVPNVDKTFQKAIKAGAKELMPLVDQFWGDRHGRVEDPWGNRWSLATRIENVTAKQLRKRMAEQKPPG